MELIVTPGSENVDALLDPAWAAHEALRLYAAQFAAADQVLEYGTALVKRLMVTQLETVEDLVLVCACLRQAVAAFDAWLHDAKAGSAEAAELHLRTLFEVSLSISWIFSQGKEQWARRLYVGSVRRKRDWARRLVIGSPAHAEFDAMWKSRYGFPYPISNDAAAAAAADAENLDSLLTNNVYAATNAEFDAKKGKKRHDPPWYSVGAGAVASIGEMARRLGRAVDYSGVYAPLSTLAHGSDTYDHFGVSPEGYPFVNAIRSPERLGSAFVLAGATAFGTYQTFLQQYRPGEEQGFRQEYRDKWRPLLYPPQVAVDAQFVPLQVG